MAITVKSTPSWGTYMAAHNDLFFVVSSSNVAQPNFKFVFDVYVNAVLVARIKEFPEPTYSYGVFNASLIVRNYLNSMYFGGEAAFLTAKTTLNYFKQDFVIKYGEEYGTPVTTYTNLTVGGTNTVYNYYNSLLPGANYSKLDLYANKFLTTNTDTTFYVTAADNFFINYWNQAGAAITYRVKTYNAAGTLINNVTTTSSTELAQLNCGPIGINATHANIITSNIAYYTVENGTDILTFNIDCWPKFPNKQLVFLNELGGYESAYFRGKNKRTAGITRKTFGKNDYQIVDSGGAMTYNNPSTNTLIGNSQIYSVKRNEKFTLTTHDFLTDAQYVWLAGLVQSSQIYMEFNKVALAGSPAYYNQSMAAYIPVKINSDTYEYNTRMNAQLQALQVDVEILKAYNSQYQ